MLNTSEAIIKAFKAKLPELGVSVAPVQSIVHQVLHTFNDVDLSTISLEWTAPRQNSSTKQWFTTLAVKGLEPERALYGGNGYKALNEGESVPAIVPSPNKLSICTLVVSEARRKSLQPKIDNLLVAIGNEEALDKKAPLEAQLADLKKQLTPEGNAALVVF